MKNDRRAAAPTSSLLTAVDRPSESPAKSARRATSSWPRPTTRIAGTSRQRLAMNAAMLSFALIVLLVLQPGERPSIAATPIASASTLLRKMPRAAAW